MCAAGSRCNKGWSLPLPLPRLIAPLSVAIYQRLHAKAIKISSSEECFGNIATVIVQKPGLLQWKYLVRGWSQGTYRSILEAVFASYATTLPNCGIGYNRRGDHERIVLATCGTYVEYLPSHGSETSPDQWGLYQAWIRARVNTLEPRPVCDRDGASGLMSVIYSTWLTSYTRTGIFANGIAGHARDVVWLITAKSGMAFTTAEEYVTVTLCQLMGQIQHRGDDLTDGFAAASFIGAYRRRFGSVDSSHITCYGVNIRPGAFSCLYSLGRFAKKAVEMVDDGSVRVSSGGRTSTAVASDPPMINGCPSVMFDAWVQAVEQEAVAIHDEAAEAWDCWFEIVFDPRKSHTTFPIRCHVCYLAVSDHSLCGKHTGCVHPVLVN